MVTARDQAASLVEALAWSLTWSRVFDPSDLFEVIARLSHYRADTETHGLLQVSHKRFKKQGYAH